MLRGQTGGNTADASPSKESSLGVSALGGAALWPDTGSWHHALKDSLWMHPWYVLTLVGAAGSSCGGACGPGSRLFAWVYVGVAFFIGVVVPAVTVLF